MNLWHHKNAKKFAGPHSRLSGKIADISGDCSNIQGCCFIQGNVTTLAGDVSNLTGLCRGLQGNLTNLRGDLSGIRGHIDPRLIGNVSGLQGDVTQVWGKADNLQGRVAELLDQGLLWPKDHPLALEMFASRYSLPMEFLDNSGAPALIAFYALQGSAVHWVTVSHNQGESFVVGPLVAIRRISPGQEIIKVAVPSNANWQLLDNLELLHTNKIYAFEQVAAPVQTLFDSSTVFPSARHSAAFT